jgi:linoleoyl-CoA desaturase
MTFTWVTFKDFVQLSRYKRKGLLATQGKTFGTELWKLIFQKVMYHSVFVVLPLVLIDLPWYHIMIPWFLMHFVAGLILALVFQPAHVMLDAEYPLANDNLTIEEESAIHQMMTTANFANNNRILSWYVGGLNFQIEHHLFPNMSHVHHRQVSKIVKATAQEYGVPYHEKPTFIGAIIDHTKMLHFLGKKSTQGQTSVAAANASV